ncbi:hypothetical protein OPIT5_24055 [Opitutaceae bacterium TAV5]|nr:hypothetical protein OPIT5_24055 [Opitutaceae bacterium TAV5]
MTAEKVWATHSASFFRSMHFAGLPIHANLSVCLVDVVVVAVVSN